MLETFLRDFGAELGATIAVAFLLWVLARMRSMPGYVERAVSLWLIRWTMRGEREKQWREILETDLAEATTLAERWEVVRAAFRLASNPASLQVAEPRPVTRTGADARITSANVTRMQAGPMVVDVAFDDGTAVTAIIRGWDDLRIEYHQAGSTEATWSHLVHGQSVPNLALRRLLLDLSSEQHDSRGGPIVIWRRT